MRKIAEKRKNQRFTLGEGRLRRAAQRRWGPGTACRARPWAPPRLKIGQSPDTSITQVRATVRRRRVRGRDGAGGGRTDLLRSATPPLTARARPRRPPPRPSRPSPTRCVPRRRAGGGVPTPSAARASAARSQRLARRPTLDEETADGWRSERAPGVSDYVQVPEERVGASSTTRRGADGLASCRLAATIGRHRLAREWPTARCHTSICGDKVHGWPR